MQSVAPNSIPVFPAGGKLRIGMRSYVISTAKCPAVLNLFLLHGIRQNDSCHKTEADNYSVYVASRIVGNGWDGRAVEQTRCSYQSVAVPVLGVGGVLRGGGSGGDVFPVFVRPEPGFGVIPDLIAYNVDDLLGECFYDFFLVCRFVEGGRFDDLAGVGLVFSAACREAEGKDDVGAGSVGQMGGGG